MPAMILSRVLLPLPFGPMTLKNSPRWTSIESSCRASKRRKRVRRKPRSASCFSEVVRSVGTRNTFVRFSVVIAISLAKSDLFGKLCSSCIEVEVADQQDDHRDGIRHDNQRRVNDVDGAERGRAQQDFPRVLNDLSDRIEGQQTAVPLGNERQRIDDRTRVEEQLKPELPDVPEIAKSHVQRRQQE